MQSASMIELGSVHLVGPFHLDAWPEGRIPSGCHPQSTLDSLPNGKVPLPRAFAQVMHCPCLWTAIAQQVAAGGVQLSVFLTPGKNRKGNRDKYRWLCVGLGVWTCEPERGATLSQVQSQWCAWLQHLAGWAVGKKKTV